MKPRARARRRSIPAQQQSLDRHQETSRTLQQASVFCGMCEAEHISGDYHHGCEGCCSLILKTLSAFLYAIFSRSEVEMGAESRKATDSAEDSKG
jgi:hypothetical protein